MRIYILMAAATLLAGGSGALSYAKDGEDKVPEEKALVQTAEALVAAYNGGILKDLMALWSENGVYSSQETGERFKGRQAIEKENGARLAQAKGSRMNLSLDSVRQITSEVASLDGTAKISKTGENPVEFTFAMILVKKDGKWLIDSLRESEPVTTASPYEQLKELEWMIGEWAQKEGDVAVKIVCSWRANKNFLSRFFTVKVKGEITHQGLQIVGWDPIHRHIRSWVFESDGTFGGAVWQRDGDRWTIKGDGVLPDGKHSTATQVITKVDADKYTWQSLSRAVEGRPLPNTELTTLTRVASNGKE